MSVKDRLDRLEARIGEPNFEFPLDTHSEMIHSIRERMDKLEGLVDRTDKLFNFAADHRTDICRSIKKLENNNNDCGDLHRKCNHLYRCMEGVQFKIKEFEALEARVEELENAEADTRRPAPDNSTKPEKFIKIVDDKNEQHMVRFPTIGSIKSYWGESRGNITFIVGDLWAIKSYSDKESWQHDLNKIEWFIYDDALLLDLTSDGVWDEPGTKLWSTITATSNHHDICPICKERLVYYATENIYAGEAKLMCTQCNYKES